jgi:hypothetical protein
MSESERGERQPSERRDDDQPEALRAKVAAARDEAVRARIDLVGADDTLTVEVTDSMTTVEVCRAWYEAAAILYAAAAAAYAQGNGDVGLMYELAAANHVAIGQACTRAAGG